MGPPFGYLPPIVGVRFKTREYGRDGLLVASSLPDDFYKEYRRLRPEAVSLGKKERERLSRRYSRRRRHQAEGRPSREPRDHSATSTLKASAPFLASRRTQEFRSSSSHQPSTSTAPSTQRSEARISPCDWTGTNSWLSLSRSIQLSLSYSFMQPEIVHLIQNRVPEDPARNNPASLAQHGNLLSDHSGPNCLSHGDGGDREPVGDTVSDRSSVAILPGTDDSVSCSIDSPKQDTPARPVDRVIEYENTWIPSPKGTEQLGFKVIPSRINGPIPLSVENFPNEVLTHILSHLPPASLSSMSLVNRRFHSLVTTPHAWRIAFSRYFPGPAAIEAQRGRLDSDEFEHLLLRKRTFCRLTALASWRNEYILRTRLLRSLARGRPAQYQPSGQQASPRTGPASSGLATYNSLLLYPVSHIDGAFGSGSEKKPAMFVHGAREQGIASASDPTASKAGLGAWGISDPQMFNHFADLFPGESQWGLGAGEFVGLPNVMDVSQQYGLVYGEGCPRGRTYFLSSNEKRGRFLSLTDSETRSQPQLGIPKLVPVTTSICSVWIAKSPQILNITNGLCGILAGTSTGVLTAYAIGPNHSYNQRYERGQVTARWVLCPGVPIIAIRVDDNFSTKRHAYRRIWAVVLNALGEVFYLTEIPLQRETNPKPTPEQLDQLAWETGRTVRWELVEATRRVARPDPFNTQLVDASVPHIAAFSDDSGSQAALATAIWTVSKLTLDLPRMAQITTAALDMSTIAKLTVSEDPLLSMCGDSDSSETSTPLSGLNESSVPSQIPGHRARFIAVGTSTGTVIVWNIRSPVSPNAEISNNLEPIRVINTDSPQVSCIALTSLYLVHGGNDGLVQAWDLLASSLQPIRTINSRFSSRARRRLQQAEATVQGVGHNFFAAGAICLDPDSTRLRGIVSLGTQLRYWSYSSFAADQYKSNKRRLRYSQRRGNRSPEVDRYSHTGRGALQDFIMDERLELERQKKEQEKAKRHLSGRFGVDLFGPGASEDELLAYACMLSEESYTSDERKRRESNSSAGGSSSSGTIAAQLPIGAHAEPSILPSTLGHGLPLEPQVLEPLDEELEPDLAEAIRRSLEDALTSSPTPTPLREDKFEPVFNDPAAERLPSLSDASGPMAERSTSQQEADDFELALRLSLAEQEGQTCDVDTFQESSSFLEDQLEDFPSLDNAAASRSSHGRRGRGKGKGRA
ncbi:hypothetical protein CISG_04240 [Coccidioides immitis RMSCC 3703]|uniref:Probable E3 ubiquitin ligase complex SCF subunit sconB n=1 Tax=Coccidioides immitis RMSCC 3703 TaxID=454286 RepID=A0A0J8QTD0_COCIT|nr:hypothetical protein CISG_04240 [Coccidioides immitis RMSCC 3703]